MVARIRALDGLRGICALLVVVFHSDLVLHSGHLVNHGWLAVDVFFVLSGFVIALRYETMLCRNGGVRSFVAARVRKLVPVHVMGTIVVSMAAFPMLAMGSRPSTFAGSLAVATALGILLIPNNPLVQRYMFGMPDAFPVNGPLWTLFDEWIANIAYATALHRLKARQAFVLIAICWTCLLLHAWNFRFGWQVGDKTGELLFGAIRATSEFMAGVVLSRMYAARHLKRLSRVRPELVYVVCFLVASVPSVRPLPMFEFLAATLGATTAVAVLAQSERPVPSVFVWLGEISYPLYASHMAVFLLAEIWLKSGERHSVFFAIPMAIAAVGLAFVISRTASAIEVYSRPATSRSVIPGVG